MKRLKGPMGGGQGPFSRRVLIGLSALATVSFAVAFAVGIFGDDWFEGPRGGASAGADGFSASAIGHEALVKLLQRQGHSVTLSRQERLRGVAADGLLVLAEPELYHLRELTEQDSFDEPAYGAPKLLRRIRSSGATRALVVLPKWDAYPNWGERPEWVGEASPVSEGQVRGVLTALGLSGGEPLRVSDPGGWDVGARLQDDLSESPTLKYPQLMAPHPEMSAWISAPTPSGDGVLVGLYQDDELEIAVLADPDVTANHGLWRSGNAAVVISVVDALVDPGAPVIFDEALHGHTSRASLWAKLFEFPLVLFMLQMALIALVVLWASLRRFGAPEPVPPALAAGRQVLIEHTAELLRFGGHSAYTLERYWHRTVRHLARVMGGPEGRADAQGHRERLRWLSEQARRRNLPIKPEVLEEGISQIQGRGTARRVLLLARQVHQLRQALLGRRASGRHRR